MGDNKQRLRPWLINQIESKQIEGLFWLNDEKTKFQMPWLHKGKQNWDPKYCKLFEEWEKNNGRYQPGVNKPNYPQWKTRMRCALHKSQDFKLLEEAANETYKIYEILPKEEKKSSSAKEGSTRDDASQHSDDSMNAATPGSFLPTFVENATCNSGELDRSSNDSDVLKEIPQQSFMKNSVEMESLPNDLADIRSGELLKLEDGIHSLGNVSIDEVVMISDHFGSLGIKDEQQTHLSDVLDLIGQSAAAPAHDESAVVFPQSENIQTQNQCKLEDQQVLQLFLQHQQQQQQLQQQQQQLQQQQQQQLQHPLQQHQQGQEAGLQQFSQISPQQLQPNQQAQQPLQQTQQNTQLQFYQDQQQNQVHLLQQQQQNPIQLLQQQQQPQYRLQQYQHSQQQLVNSQCQAASHAMNQNLVAADNRLLTTPQQPPPPVPQTMEQLMSVQLGYYGPTDNLSYLGSFADDVFEMYQPVDPQKVELDQQFMKIVGEFLDQSVENLESIIDMHKDQLLNPANELSSF